MRRPARPTAAPAPSTRRRARPPPPPRPARPRARSSRRSRRRAERREGRRRCRRAPVRHRSTKTRRRSIAEGADEVGAGRPRIDRDEREDADLVGREHRTRASRGPDRGNGAASGKKPRATRPPTMTTASRTANTRSSRSSSRKLACHGFRSAAIPAIFTPTIALRPIRARGPRRRTAMATHTATTTSAAQHEPALDAVDVGEHLLDLVGEEEGQEEGERDAHQRGDGVHRQELPERHAGDTCREEGRRPQPHHVTRGEHDLHAVAAVRRLELFLTSGAQDPADGPPAEDLLPPVVSDPVQDDVALRARRRSKREARSTSAGPSGGTGCPPVTIGSSSGMGTPSPATNRTRNMTDVAQLLDERATRPPPHGARFGFRNSEPSVYSDSPVRSEGALPWR